MAQAKHVDSPIWAPATGGSACPATTPICTAHAIFVEALAEEAPCTIPVNPDAIDLEDRADYLTALLTALSDYLTAILRDAAQSIAGALDLRQIDALLADLTSEVSGTFQHAIGRRPGRGA